MPHTEISCREVYYKTPSEVRGIKVDMRGLLDDGEVLTGTPTITVTGPTTSSPAVTTAAQLINGEAVPAGKAVTFTISGGSDATDYAILVSCSTSASQTVQAYCLLSVRVPTFSAP